MILATIFWIALAPAILSMLVTIVTIRTIAPATPSTVRFNALLMAAVIAALATLAGWLLVRSYLTYLFLMMAVFPIGIGAATLALVVFKRSLVRQR